MNTYYDSALETGYTSGLKDELISKLRKYVVRY